MPIDELDGTPEEYPDINAMPDFDDRIHARQRLLLREMYKGLLDNLNGLKGFLHPIQLIYNVADMIRHPLTTTRRAATFAWENKIRTLTGLGLNILEGQVVGAVIESATFAAESSEMVFNNTTMAVAAESQLPVFFVEAEQLASNVASGASHACSGGVCTLPVSSSASFIPAPIIHSARPNNRQKPANTQAEPAKPEAHQGRFRYQ